MNWNWIDKKILSAWGRDYGKPVSEDKLQEEKMDVIKILGDANYYLLRNDIMKIDVFIEEKYTLQEFNEKVLKENLDIPLLQMAPFAAVKYNSHTGGGVSG